MPGHFARSALLSGADDLIRELGGKPLIVARRACSRPARHARTRWLGALLRREEDAMSASIGFRVETVVRAVLPSRPAPCATSRRRWACPCAPTSR